MKLRNDLLEQIKIIFKENNYSLPPFMLIGIRDEDNQGEDIFNDPLGCIVNGNIYLGEACDGTTDPGKYWQDNPMNKKGTAHLILGLHRRAFKLGIHGAGTPYAHEAFVQASPVTVKRYKTFKDYMEGKFTLDKGMFGINFHAVFRKIVHVIGHWSAGCQVNRLIEDLKKYIELYKGTDQHKLQLFEGEVDYYLFDKKELIV